MRFGDIIVIRGWLKEQTIEYFMKKLVLPDREAAEKEAMAQQDPSAQPSSTVKGWSSPVAKQKPLFDTFPHNDGLVNYLETLMELKGCPWAISTNMFSYAPCLVLLGTQGCIKILSS